VQIQWLHVVFLGRICHTKRLRLLILLRNCVICHKSEMEGDILARFCKLCRFSVGNLADWDCVVELCRLLSHDQRPQLVNKRPFAICLLWRDWGGWWYLKVRNTSNDKLSLRNQVTLVKKFLPETFGKCFQGVSARRKGHVGSPIDYLTTWRTSWNQSGNVAECYFFDVTGRSCRSFDDFGVKFSRWLLKAPKLHIVCFQRAIEDRDAKRFT